MCDRNALPIVNERQNRAFAAEMLNFSIVNEPPNAACATEMLNLPIVNERQNRAFATEMLNLWSSISEKSGSESRKRKKKLRK